MEERVTFPMPDVFPEGTRFWEDDGTPLTFLVDHGGWCSARSSTVMVGRPDIAEDIRTADPLWWRPFDDIDEAEFRRLAAERGQRSSKM